MIPSLSRTKVTKAVELLRSNPRLLLRRIVERTGQVGTPPAPKPDEKITRTIDEVLAALRASPPATLVAYGDATLARTLRDAMQATTVCWASHEEGDILAGAVRAVEAGIGASDAVVVGGADAALAWSNVLRELQDQAVLPALHWVGAGWEFCGSQIPVPAEIDGADLYLFNHFSEYFQVKDPLLVRIEASDSRSTLRIWRVLGPYASLRLSLDDLLPDRTGPSVVDIRTEHPVLTRGRHHRWRVCADVHWEGSFTTLHGGHDYGGPRRVESRRPASDLQRGGVAVALPNPSPGDGDPQVRVIVPNGESLASLERSWPVNQLSIPADPSDAARRAGVYGYSYVGAGTPFWYAMGRTAAGRPVLSANHELSVRIREDPPGISGSARATYHALEELGLMLHPHVLPLPGLDQPVEFGFSFRAANPTIRSFRGWHFDASGSFLSTVAFTSDQDEPVFPSELASQIAGLSPGGLLVFGPDWSAAGVDPALISFGGDLVVRHRESGDTDITEFQSCWRNLGLKVAAFPHWIHPSNAIAGRTNVVARIRSDEGMRTAVVIAHGSGTRPYQRHAVAQIRVYGSRGERMSREVAVDAFCTRIVWCDELFEGSSSLHDAFGALQVTSLDADLNCQLLTLAPNGSVSLQHLWGY